MTGGADERGKCAYCRGSIVAEDPRQTDDGLCCFACWQVIPEVRS